MHEMRELVERGPNEHPGAKSIIRDDGKTVFLFFVDFICNGTVQETLREKLTANRFYNHLNDSQKPLFQFDTLTRYFFEIDLRFVQRTSDVNLEVGYIVERHIDGLSLL